MGLVRSVFTRRKRKKLQRERALPFQDARDARGDEFVADVAPAGSFRQERSSEIPREKKGNQWSKCDPNPTPLVQLGFPLREHFVHGDGAKGALQRGEENDYERHESEMDPGMAAWDRRHDHERSIDQR